MHITVERGEDHAILHLRGEFDGYYRPMLEDEIESIRKAGVNQVVLNLRMVRFINSTALGTIIRVNKMLTAEGGRLAISQPSPFCRDIIKRVGLEVRVPMFASDEAAVRELGSKERSPSQSVEAQFEEDRSSVLFSLVDRERLEHYIPVAKASNPVHGHAFGSNWNGLGSMSSLDDEGIQFTWNGGNTDLSPFDMGQMLSLGTKLNVKFRLPLLQRGYRTAEVEVSQIEELADGVKVGTTFTAIDDVTREAVRQFAEDMAYLRDELRRATDGE